MLGVHTPTADNELEKGVHFCNAFRSNAVKWGYIPMRKIQTVSGLDKIPSETIEIISIQFLDCLLGADFDLGALAHFHTSLYSNIRYALHLNLQR